MIRKKVKINLEYLSPNASFIYPLYSEGGEKIVEPRVILTDKKIAQIISQFGKIVYYVDSGERAVIPVYRMKIAYNTAKEIMEEIAKTEKLGKSTFREAEKLVEDIISDLNVSEIEAVNLIKDLKSYDEYLYNHSVNVGILAAIFAKKLDQFSSEEVKNLTLGAYLLDIGLKKIDKQLLNKEDKLNITETQKIKRHPQLGYEILNKMGSIDPIVLQSVLLHHEKFNNRGYYQLPYEHLPLYPKIVSICDVYDALTSERPYRKDPFSPREALKLILNSIEVHYHYELVSSFVNLMNYLLNSEQFFYSVNDICELNTNELALIREPNVQDLLKPRILVFCKFYKEKNKTSVNFYRKPFGINLAEDNSRRMRKILNNQRQIDQINRMIQERNVM